MMGSRVCRYHSSSDRGCQGRERCLMKAAQCTQSATVSSPVDGVEVRSSVEAQCLCEVTERGFRLHVDGGFEHVAAHGDEGAAEEDGEGSKPGGDVVREDGSLGRLCARVAADDAWAALVQVPLACGDGGEPRLGGGEHLNVFEARKAFSEKKIVIRARVEAAISRNGLD